MTPKASSTTAPDGKAGVATPGRRIFDQFPYGLVLVDGGGRIVALNARSAELLSVDPEGVPEAGVSCCELICDRVATATEGECLTRRALDAKGETQPEVRIEVDGGAAPACVWVAASRLVNDHARVLFHLRPGSVNERQGDDPLDEPPASGLRIFTLGSLRIETESGEIGGEWMAQRPGELFKYLICGRSRTVASEQIAEALWPNAGQREALTSVRHYVHQLRVGLEPDRSPRSRSPYVATRRGGYALEGAWVDADEFGRRVERGLRALMLEDVEGARAELEAARSLYHGDFLAEDPYAEWAAAERDRLRELASDALRALVEIAVTTKNLEAAADYARELTEIEPFDIDSYRDFLRICLRLGRRSEAVRGYGLLRNRTQQLFGEEPGFTLSELAASSWVEAPTA